MSARTALLAGMLAVFVTAAGFPATVWLSDGSNPIDRVGSPDGLWRLELDAPTRWQKLISRSADFPATARIVDLRTGQAGRRSPAFELSGSGEIFWTADGAQIGSSALYNRESDEWWINQ